LIKYKKMTEEQTVISETKLFVGGLEWGVRGRQLNDFFSTYGPVKFARVKLRDDGKSRGFGFVEFENAEDAAKAQADMDGKELEGREIKVDFAKENPERMQQRKEEAMAAEGTTTDMDEIDLDSVETLF
jgi:RNA recognition motif-containing protein